MERGTLGSHDSHMTIAPRVLNKGMAWKMTNMAYRLDHDVVLAEEARGGSALVEGADMFPRCLRLDALPPAILLLREEDGET